MILENLLNKRNTVTHPASNTSNIKDILNGKNIQQIQAEFRNITDLKDIKEYTQYKSQFNSIDIQNFLDNVFLGKKYLSELPDIVNHLNTNLSKTGTVASKTGNIMSSAFSLIGGALTGTLITSAIDLGLNFITERLQRTQKLVDAAKAAGQEWEQKDTSFQSQKQQYTQLKTQLDSGSLSE